LTADGTDDVSYTYDDTGNIATMTVGTATTTYIYDDADEMTSDGTSTFSYDENGNLTGDGTDSYTYDYRNMLTSATVDSTTTTFAYDGDGVRSSKESPDYLYDRESGFPLLVDDGTNAYLQQDGALASVDGSGEATYLLDDALGSVRGVTDDGGTLTAAADYNVFGSLRNGDSFALGFTGEQADAETGLTYLRARYLDPAVGRFISADTVSPNAPGTQGFNGYAYVADNPASWVDPTGNLPDVDPGVLIYRWLTNPDVYALIVGAMRWQPTSAMAAAGFGALLAMAVAPETSAPPKSGTGIAARTGWAMLNLGGAIFACVFFGPCLDGLDKIKDALPHGSNGPADQPDSNTRPNPSQYPSTPKPASPTPTDSPKSCSQIGTWVTEASMSPAALSYQQRVQAYANSELKNKEFRVPYISGIRRDPFIDFDGCRSGILIEAKGCHRDLPKIFAHVLPDIIDQMTDQSAAATSVGSQVEWYFAEQTLAAGAMYGSTFLPNISVHSLPAVPPC
jgi:RHS repeat-associated protein